MSVDGFAPARAGVRRAAGRPAGQVRAGVRWHWLYDARTDLLLSWCWVPFFVIGLVVASRTGAGADADLGTLFTGVLLVSLLHQPLTLLLVYGDAGQFRLRRRLFTWAPAVAVIVITVAVGLNLWLLVPIAAVWNAVHTLQQRYGLLRIHARKAGYGDSRLDRAVLFVPFVAVLALAAGLPATSRQIDRLSGELGGGQNARAAAQLVADRPAILMLVGPLLLAAAAVIVAYARQEWRAARRGEADAGKWVYLAGTLTLIGSAVIDPAAGLVAYIAAHALEYAIVVARTLRSRYDRRPERAPSRTALGTLAATPVRRAALLAAFFGVFGVVDVRLRGTLSPSVYLSAIYTVGLLHFLYDAVIWKTRRPVVAATFGLPAAPPQSPVATPAPTR